MGERGGTRIASPCLICGQPFTHDPTPNLAAGLCSYCRSVFRMKFHRFPSFDELLGVALRTVRGAHYSGKTVSGGWE